MQGLRKRCGRRTLGLAVVLVLAAARAVVANDVTVLSGIAAGGVETRLAALMLSSQEGGDLKVSLLTVPLSGPGGETAMALIVDIDGEPLLSGFSNGRLAAEIYAYAIDSNDAVRASVGQVLFLEEAEYGARLAAGRIKFLGHLDLEAGDYSLRVLVLERRTGRWSLQVLPVTVPQAGAAPPFEPLFSQPAEEWVLAREQAALSGGPRLPFPLLRDGRAVVPATPEAVGEQRLAESGGAEPPPMAGRTGAAAPAASLDARSQDFLLGYLAALDGVAEGDVERGRTALSELSAATLGSGATSDRERVDRVLGLVASQMAAASPDSLVPLLLLYEELYEEHMLAGRYMLAGHARAVLVQLAKAYVRFDGSRESHRLAAAALVSLAGVLMEHGASGEAERLFESALEQDGQNAGALLSLAYLRESYGDYGEAARFLKRLARDRSDNPEVRLRLAISLTRTGAKRRAEELLRQCVEVVEPRWVSTVAYQELAVLLERGEDGKEAVKLLRQAAATRPDVQRIHIQLAAALDRQGFRGEARKALARLDPEAGRTRVSARFEYSRWPRWAVDESRTELRRAAQERLTTLAKVVDFLGAPG